MTMLRGGLLCQFIAFSFRKREGFAHEATSMYQTIRTELNIPVKAVTIYERYDIEGVSDEDLAKAKQLISPNHR